MHPSSSIPNPERRPHAQPARLCPHQPNRKAKRGHRTEREREKQEEERDRRALNDITLSCKQVFVHLWDKWNPFIPDESQWVPQLHVQGVSVSCIHSGFPHFLPDLQRGTTASSLLNHIRLNYSPLPPSLSFNSGWLFMLSEGWKWEAQ